MHFSLKAVQETTWSLLLPNLIDCYLELMTGNVHKPYFLNSPKELILFPQEFSPVFLQKFPGKASVIPRISTRAPPKMSS